MIGVKAVQQELASRRLASLAATAFNLPMMLESTEWYLYYWVGKNKEIPVSQNLSLWMAHPERRSIRPRNLELRENCSRRSSLYGVGESKGSELIRNEDDLLLIF